MPVFTIQAPDGRKIKIKADDQQTAIRGAQEWVAANPKQPAGPPKGALAAVKRRDVPESPPQQNIGDIARGVAHSAFQGTTFGWGDELAASGAAALDPLVNGDSGRDYGQRYDKYLGQERNTVEDFRQSNPVAAYGSEFAGAIPSAMLGGLGLAGKAVSIGGRALAGSGIGAAQGAVYGAGAADGDVGDRTAGAITSGLAGGVLGAAAPYVGNKIAQMGQRAAQGQAINVAARNAPKAADIKSLASSMFTQADTANPVITRNAFGNLYQSIETATKKFRPNAQLDPKATGALGMLTQTLDEITAPGSNVLADLKDLHILRQAAQKAAMSSEGRDATIANIMIDKIDDFVKGLKPSDISGAADPGSATKALMDGISTWSRASKASTIETAIETARNQASGFENGLRIQFRRIMNNDRLYRQFSPAEKQAIQDVVRGTPLANLTKLIGKFGFGGGNASNMLGGTIGFGAGSMTPLGPVGGILAAGGATAARKGSEKLTEMAANRAAGAIASGKTKVVPPVNPANVPFSEWLARQSAVPIAGQTPPFEPLKIVVRP